ncbi:hypothetical protein PO878_05660 [Iamia majanohamensis]|uniref:DUF3618 domain-containing protein n=1 Tax=Iamia majanohamensis TaxID=467976 RepID=A0AAF0BSF2_9ACTN|nr:hypothetical protein [Iamia majanohamensis]WCO68211.1 hypothetical protein PO878_05660 [Iamia majanohamensis]
MSQSTTDQSRGTGEQAAQQGKEVASTAVDQARGVAGTASEQLSTVSGEAVDQARTVLDGATTELRDQLQQRLGDLAGTARGTSEELRALCEGRPEDAGRTRDLAERASRQLGHMADRADELGVEGVVEEVGSFARRRPVVFLAGAAAAGVLVGRLARAGQQARSEGGDGPSSGDARPPVPSAAGSPREVGADGGAGATTDPWPTEVPLGTTPPPADGPALTPPGVGPEGGPGGAPGSAAGWQGR